MSNVPANATPHQQLTGFLNRPDVLKQVRLALPEHLTAERFIRIALSAAIRTPAIYQCDPRTVAQAVITCSELGLEPNGRDAHLIPFENRRAGRFELQVIPDYKGLIKLAYQSGMVQSVAAKSVRQGDYFKFQFGLHEDLVHIPAAADARGQLTHAWAMAKLKDGGTPFVVLDRTMVERRRSSSRSADRDSSVWNKDEDAMWAKSAVRELAKFIPQSPQLERALAYEDERDYGSDSSLTMAAAFQEPEGAAATKSERLAGRIGGEEAPAKGKRAGKAPAEAVAETEDSAEKMDAAIRQFTSEMNAASPLERPGIRERYCGAESPYGPETRSRCAALFNEYQA